MTLASYDLARFASTLSDLLQLEDEGKLRAIQEALSRRWEDQDRARWVFVCRLREAISEYAEALP